MHTGLVNHDSSHSPPLLKFGLRRRMTRSLTELTCRRIEVKEIPCLELCAAPLTAQLMKCKKKFSIAATSIPFIGVIYKSCYLGHYPNLFRSKHSWPTMLRKYENSSQSQCLHICSNDDIAKSQQDNYSFEI
uniref:Uncharacterized protein n=1 Tax=Glossina palpalis gambiensis TaxID=67801 RepID=A0A1B0BVC5_9MUSC